jgi:hypothetical protein
MPRGHTTITRTFGPYRDSMGDRTIVTLEIRQDDTTGGRTTASFTGEEYRKHSSHPQACGQTQGSAPQALKDLWDRWHLNDMRAECEHQRALGWTWATHPSQECPECGYRLGSKWLFEPLPQDFLAQCEKAAHKVTVVH